MQVSGTWSLKNICDGGMECGTFVFNLSYEYKYVKLCFLNFRLRI